jgi:hypothetical protein
MTDDQNVNTVTVNWAEHQAERNKKLAVLAELGGMHAEGLMRMDPACSDQWRRVDDLQSYALELIQICELEKRRICGGDGYWYSCCNLIARTIGDMTMAWHGYLRTTP